MDATKVEKSIASGSKVINLVGILEEKNKQNFKNIHLKAKIVSYFKDIFIYYSKKHM